MPRKIYFKYLLVQFEICNVFNRELITICLEKCQYQY